MGIHMSFLAKISLDPSQASRCSEEGCIPSREDHRTATKMKRGLKRGPVKGNGGIDLFRVGETER